MKPGNDYLFEEKTGELQSAARDAFLLGALADEDARAVAAHLAATPDVRAQALARLRQLNAIRERESLPLLSWPFPAEPAAAPIATLTSDPLLAERPDEQQALSVRAVVAGAAGAAGAAEPAPARRRPRVGWLVSGLGLALAFGVLAALQSTHSDASSAEATNGMTAVVQGWRGAANPPRANPAAAAAGPVAGLAASAPAPAAGGALAASPAAHPVLPGTAPAVPAQAGAGRTPLAPLRADTLARPAGPAENAAPRVLTSAAPAARPSAGPVMLRGHVFNELGQPLAGATVLVKGAAAAVTDAGGAYQLQAPLGTRLYIGYAGYADEQLIASQAYELDATLQPRARRQARD